MIISNDLIIKTHSENAHSGAHLRVKLLFEGKTILKMYRPPYSEIPQILNRNFYIIGNIIENQYYIY